MVASAAISRASEYEFGFVLKTTKKGIDVERENVEGSGRVICSSLSVKYVITNATTYSAFEWYYSIRVQWDF
jgi:hypothetical protein